MTTDANSCENGQVNKAEQPLYLSDYAALTLRGMIEYCLNKRVCLGMDEGFATFEPEVEHDFVKELRAFAESSFPIAAVEHQIAPLPQLSQSERENLLDFHEAVCSDAQHTVDKDGMRRLAEIGAAQSTGFGKHRLTEFGVYLLTAQHVTAPVQPDSSASSVHTSRGASPGQVEDQPCSLLPAVKVAGVISRKQRSFNLEVIDPDLLDAGTQLYVLGTASMPAPTAMPGENWQQRWIDHGPSMACPVPRHSTKVDIRRRNGHVELGTWACNACWVWREHDKDDHDVVAYRVSKPS